MSRVEVASGHHRVLIDADASASVLVKLATAMWQETAWHECATDNEPDASTFDGRTNWRLYPAPAEDADTGE